MSQCVQNRFPHQSVSFDHWFTLMWYPLYMYLFLSNGILSCFELVPFVNIASLRKVHSYTLVTSVMISANRIRFLGFKSSNFITSGLKDSTSGLFQMMRPSLIDGFGMNSRTFSVSSVIKSINTTWETVATVIEKFSEHWNILR